MEKLELKPEKAIAGELKGGTAVPGADLMIASGGWCSHE